MKPLPNTTFVFPKEQRVLTPQEYAFLGYLEVGKTPTARPTKPLKSALFGINLPAYRAETKEEYAVDFAVGFVKVGYTISTGGVVPAAKTALGYVWSIVS